MRCRGLVLLLLLAGLGPAASSQVYSLTTTYSDNSGCDGNYFDVTNTGPGPVRLLSLDGNFSSGTRSSVEIWTRPGTFVGHETTPGSWSLVGTATFSSAGPGVPTPIPIPLNILLAPGETRGFILHSPGGGVLYTIGTAPGLLLASDAYLEIYEGAGVCPQWIPVYTRRWNGTIHYELAGCPGSCGNPHQLSPTLSGFHGSRTSVDTLLVDTTACAVDHLVPGCATGGEDAFLSFQAPIDGQAVVDTCGPATTFDTILVALAGSCVGPELACNDDTCGSGSEITFPVTAGETYLIMVDGAGGAIGTAEVTVSLTEVATTYQPCHLLSPPQLLQPAAQAVERLRLPSGPSSGMGRSGIAYNPCYGTYYGFDLGGVTSEWEVWDAAGTPLFSTTGVNLDARGLWHAPVSGSMEVATYDAFSGSSGGGLYGLGLDARAFPSGGNFRFVSEAPGLAGPEPAPGYDPYLDRLFSRSVGNTVRIADTGTGALLSTIYLDTLAAGSPALITHSIGYTGVLGAELVAGTADAAVLFDVTGQYVATVPLGVTVTPGDYTGSFANGLYWTWDESTTSFRGFDIFDVAIPLSCSSSAGGSFTLPPGLTTINTDSGTIGGLPSPAFDGTAFHYLSLTVPASSTVRVVGSQPFLVWATRLIVVDGILDLAGGPGGNTTGCNREGGVGGTAGAGGFPGGEGGGPAPGPGQIDGLDGQGPGGGAAGTGDAAGGGGAGHLLPGAWGTAGGSGFGGAGGPIYGLPMLGGSGGGGGSADDDSPAGIDPTDDGGGGGGGGGGVCVLNAGEGIIVTGEIRAGGGKGGESACNSGDGGGGSGGYVGLFAPGGPVVTGIVDVRGGLPGTAGIAPGGLGADGLVQTGLSPCGLRCVASGPPGVAGGEIPITVDVQTVAGSVDVSFAFSTDGGLTLTPCTAAPTSPVPSPAPGVAPGVLDFLWASDVDGVGTPVLQTGVLVRVEVDDGLAPSPDSCKTAPFDVLSSACPSFCGDCDLNGVGPSIIDSLAAAQMASSLLVPTPAQEGCCDVDSSGSITVVDALLAAQAAASLPATLSCP